MLNLPAPAPNVAGTQAELEIHTYTFLKSFSNFMDEKVRNLASILDAS